MKGGKEGGIEAIFRAEQEYKDLVEKKRIIENDKSTIESFIKELDDKKNEALQATWVKVNRYVEFFSRHFFLPPMWK